MLLESVEKGASGAAKVAAGGSSFFLDLGLFAELGGDPEALAAGAELGEEAFALLRLAAEAFEAERQGLALLARSEQPGRLLAAKLEKRGFGARAVAIALGRLAGEGSLDDGRFAEAWLRSRLGRAGRGGFRGAGGGKSIEGPQALLAGLRARGLSEARAREALARVLEPGLRAELLGQALEAELGVPGARRGEVLDRLRSAGFSGAELRDALDARDEEGEPDPFT